MKCNGSLTNSIAIWSFQFVHQHKMQLLHQPIYNHLPALFPLLMLREISWKPFAVSTVFDSFYWKMLRWTWTGKPCSSFDNLYQRRWNILEFSLNVKIDADMSVALTCLLYDSESLTLLGRHINEHNVFLMHFQRTICNGVIALKTVRF